MASNRLTSCPAAIIINLYQNKCVDPGRVAQGASAQRERAVGWEPVCRGLWEVRLESTLREGQYRSAAAAVTGFERQTEVEPRFGMRTAFVAVPGYSEEGFFVFAASDRKSTRLNSSHSH